jgi:hypothetical protein
LKTNWTKITKIGQDFEILEILEKLGRNWPISKNARKWVNFEDIGVCFFANIFFYIVELNCRSKIGDNKGKYLFWEGGTPF